ncbi:MAG TPA: DUF4307 domain-containing protein [Nocardioidaceae bacterium]|nr:DUF4307 domain-containing protein [Nocardioidaceae bacterium]
MSILDSAGHADPMLEERYGAPRRWSRLVIVVVVALLVTAGVAWVIWAGLEQSNPAVSAQVRTFEVRNAHQTDVTLVVDRRDGDAVQCSVYAQSDDHSVVGERTIDVPAGDPGTTTVNLTIETDRRAVNGVLDSCEVA